MNLARIFANAAAACAFILSIPAYGVAPAELTKENREFFENKIRPILSNSCLECHSGERGKIKGGLNLDSRELLLKGGESGAGFRAEDVEGSLIIKAVTGTGDLQMPPKKKLTEAEIADLKKWIRLNAPDPRDASKIVLKDKRSHWAFKPLVRPAVPSVKNAAWCYNWIDKFVLAELEAKQMLPAFEASRESLLRRAYFDLIGLPPSLEAVEAFVRAPNPDEAYANVIEKLLADPGYGERWARHWLDTARYSDTTGMVGNNRFNDFRYPYAYSFRDWVIHSLNSDMPYNQFIINQLAADKVPNNPRHNLAALGFLTVGQRFKQQDDVINDRIDVIGRGFLGLTLACARCHDHKFDPITSADYYALRGVFTSITEPKEGPIISVDSNSSEFREFTRKLAEEEKKAFATFYRLQREISDRFRKNAEAVFEIAYHSRAEAAANEKKLGAGLLAKAKLNPQFVNFTAKLNPSNPVTGIFLKMITQPEERGKMLKDIVEGRTEQLKCNQKVLDFLKKQPSLPSNPHEVAVLFGKMMNAYEPLVADAYAEIQDASKNAAESPRKPLLELVTYPFAMVPAAELNLDRLRQEGNRWGIFFGGMLENQSGLAKINELKMTSKGSPVRAMVVEDLPVARDSPLFIRGNAPKPGEQTRTIPRRFIEALSTDTAEPFKEGSGRLELAKAIANNHNPLTARVLVNRVWMYHFGEGLVRTPDDLGNQAGRPSHPELLDYLASWFMEDGGPSKPAWSLKALHRQIMLSKTYQQSSNTVFRNKNVNYEKLDPANTLLWHANVRRLDFESFRDALLSMAGTLDRSSIGGPSVNITDEPYSFRRSVYAYVDRSKVPDLLMQFDMAAPDQPNTRRTSTIVPQQALFLMNSPFVAQVVQKVVRHPKVVQAVVNNKNTKEGVVAIFRILLQRTPSLEEQDMAIQFLLREDNSQSSVKAATAKTTREAANRAAQKLKAQQNNNTAKRAVVNDLAFEGPNVTTNKGNAVVLNVANASKLQVGGTVTGAGIPDGTVITSVSGNSVTLSQKANVTSMKASLRYAVLVQRATFTPWEALVQAILFSNEAAYVN